MQSELNKKGENNAVLNALNRVRVLETEVSDLKTTSTAGISTAAASITSICTKVRKFYACIWISISITFYLPRQ